MTAKKHFKKPPQTTLVREDLENHRGAERNRILETVRQERRQRGKNDKCVPRSNTPDPYYLLILHGSLAKLLNPRMVKGSKIKKKKRTVFITFQYHSVHTKASDQATYSYWRLSHLGDLESQHKRAIWNLFGEITVHNTTSVNFVAFRLTILVLCVAGGGYGCFYLNSTL